MDTIVTIIIFLVIIFSIMKNMQEVAKKGREVRVPRKPGEGPVQQEMRIPEAPPAPAEREIMEVEEEVPEEPSEIPSPRPFPEEPRPVWESPRPSLEDIFGRLEEKYRRASEQPIPEVVKVEDTFEKRKPEAEIPRHTTFRPARQPLSPRHRPALVFQKQAVVNGIIMSEILGPPVGLRRQGGLWW